MQPSSGRQSAVSDRRLWLSAFTPVLAWALHLSVSYGLVELYCYQFVSMGDAVAVWALSAVAILALLAAVTGSLLCYKNRRVIADTPEDNRGLFIATAGALLGVFMAATIVMQSLPVMMIPPCI